ncbi:hypothetical protein RCF71_00875 [Staphylococcus chromogenes]|uniref:hypothetical protein n=1 Tax=Staphylococcus chromogenes TaxID=46126 RepID=UPI003B00DDB3
MQKHVHIIGAGLSGLVAATELLKKGGVHGYRALEGTFLGGCIFSGIRAAEGIHKDVTK